MAKFLIVAVCVAVAGVLAEPPAPSNYLPPQARNSLSRSYGAPDQGYSSGGRSSGSHSYNSIAESQFGGSTRSRFSNQQPAQRYNAPSFDDSVATNAASRFAPARQTGASFGAPRGFSSQSRQQPQNQYNTAASQYSRQQPQNQYNAPSFNQNSAAASQYSRQQPASSYAAAARQQPSAQYGAPSSEYGAPLARKMDDDLAEPANYEYNYQVQAGDESGAEFSHQETREDDYAQGEYRVLLPDGRMQIVEYEADEEGFRPRIRYEETGYPSARSNDGPY